MRTMRRLALLAVVWLLFNLVALPLWWGGVSETSGFRGAVQMAVLAGFVYLLLFDLLSAGWILTRACWSPGKGRADGCQKGWLLVLAALALVGMMGAKVMVDEIARETPLGGAAGEWVILFICLGLQLAYAGAVFFSVPPAGGQPED